MTTCEILWRDSVRVNNYSRVMARDSTTQAKEMDEGFCDFIFDLYFSFIWRNITHTVCGLSRRRVYKAKLVLLLSSLRRHLIKLERYRED